jgi:hypothetical protein
LLSTPVGGIFWQTEKPSNTRRSGELRFYFTLVGPDVYCVWALNKGFTGCLKGSAGHQVTNMCSGYWG